MDDARAVRLVEGVGDLNRDCQRVGDRQRTLRQPLGQRVALQVLHHQKVDSVLATHIEHRADVRMTQRREGLGFAHEPLGQLGISRNVLGQDFDGNRTVQADVTGFVDFTHPPST